MTIFSRLIRFGKRLARRPRIRRNISMKFGWNIRRNRSIFPFMFRLFTVLAAAISVVPALAAPAGSAFSGIEAVKTQAYGKSAQVVEIRGERGEPQPREWTLLLIDPKARGGVREVTVAGGQITAERAPLRGTTDIAGLAPLDTKALACDSDRVFTAVQSEAKQSGVGFHWIDYTLRTDPQSNAPVWNVKLFDHMGASVGSIRISATRGAVVSPLQTDQDMRARVESTSKESRMGGLANDVGNAANRAAKSTKDSTLRFIGSLEEAITGERTIGPKEEE